MVLKRIWKNGKFHSGENDVGHEHETSLADFDGDFRTSSCRPENRPQIVDQIAEDCPKVLEVLNRRDIEAKFDEFLSINHSAEPSYEEFKAYIEEYALEQGDPYGGVGGGVPGGRTR